MGEGERVLTPRGEKCAGHLTIRFAYVPLVTRDCAVLLDKSQADSLLL